MQSVPITTNVVSLNPANGKMYSIQHYVLKFDVIYSSEIISQLVRLGLGVRVIVFNATFNNISAILWWSVLLVEKTGVPGENHRPVCLMNY
jgi:hypothetical protein